MFPYLYAQLAAIVLVSADRVIGPPFAHVGEFDGLDGVHFLFFAIENVVLVDDLVPVSVHLVFQQNVCALFHFYEVRLGLVELLLGHLPKRFAYVAHEAFNALVHVFDAVFRGLGVYGDGIADYSESVPRSAMNIVS